MLWDMLELTSLISGVCDTIQCRQPDPITSAIGYAKSSCTMQETSRLRTRRWWWCKLPSRFQYWINEVQL